jgi:hypothetical protein
MTWAFQPLLPGGKQELDSAVAGSAAAFAARALGPSITVALSGSAAAFSAGTLGEKDTVALAGSRATFSSGALTAGSGVTTVALSGSTATFSTGLLFPWTYQAAAANAKHKRQRTDFSEDRSHVSDAEAMRASIEAMRLDEQIAEEDELVLGMLFAHMHLME